MRAARLLLLLALGQCARAEAEPPRVNGPASASAPAPPKNEGPLRVETMKEEGKPPVYVLRGGQRGPERLVFLHGMCGDGLGYAQSFQQAAARRGTLIAPQADVPCEGGGARWSKHIDVLDARITETFRALGHTEPIDDMVIIGYSQGATRAEWLARKYPERYTRLILMGGPYAANPSGLETLRGALAMAGERDRLDLMQTSARVLRSARVPATFLLIPEATHGSMGPHPEKTMDEAFAWLWENQRPRATGEAGALTREER